MKETITFGPPLRKDLPSGNDQSKSSLLNYSPRSWKIDSRNGQKEDEELPYGLYDKRKRQ